MTRRSELPCDRLRRARKALGYSDSQMAEAVGLQGENAKDDYRKMETGLRAVTGPVLVAAEALAALQSFDRLDRRMIAAIVHAAGGRIAVPRRTTQIMPKLTLHRRDDERTGDVIFEVTQ